MCSGVRCQSAQGLSARVGKTQHLFESECSIQGLGVLSDGVSSSVLTLHSVKAEVLLQCFASPNSFPQGEYPFPRLIVTYFRHGKASERAETGVFWSVDSC